MQVRDLSQRYAGRSEPGRQGTAWIKHYNATRLHSSLGNLPPIEWELRYRLGTLQTA